MSNAEIQSTSNAASVAAPGGSDDRLSVTEKVGYGLGDTASNLYWKLFENFQLFFYTDVFGITAGAAATMFLVTKLWDAINDPMIGFLSDRTRTAWGRFRPYLLWMALPFAITGAMTFYTPDVTPGWKLVYAYVTYTLVFMAYTAINIPYGALMGVITPSPLERTSVSTYRFVLAFMGGLIVQWFTEPLVNLFGSAIYNDAGEVVSVDKQAGFFWTVVCYGALASVLFVITFLTTRERVLPVSSKSNSFGDDLGDLLGNRPWLVLLFVGLFQVLAGWTRGSAIPYYFTYYVDSTFGTFLVAGTVAGIAGMLCTKMLTAIFGQRTLMILMNLGTGLLTAAYFLIDSSHVFLIYGLHVLASFISGPVPVLLWAMYADTADYSEWKNHRRATGLVFSAATFSQKFGSAIGAAIPGWALAWCHFQNPVDGVNQAQSGETISGIILLMSVFPAVFLFCSAAVMFFYNIDKELLEQIETDLKTRKLDDES